MKRAGTTGYEAFPKKMLETVKTKPISFEVFADDFKEMRRQALRIRDWQENVYVKIPVLSPAGESSMDLIRDLASEGVKLNVTAILSERQVEQVAAALVPSVPSGGSVFAGRSAGAGRDPRPMRRAALESL